jgi:hypothetical protein
MLAGRGALDDTAVMAAVVGYQRVLSRTRAGVPDSNAKARRRGRMPMPTRDNHNHSNNTRASAWDLVVGRGLHSSISQLNLSRV